MNAKELLKEKGIKDTLFVNKMWTKGGLSDMMEEYAEQFKILNKHIVIVSVCENCGEPKESHSKTSLLCNGQFSHFKQTEL